MPHAEPMPAVALVFFVIFFMFWFWHAYLLLTRPNRWMEWFMAWSWRPFGLKVSIENEQKFRKRTRLTGVIYLIFGLFFFGVWILVPKR